MARLPTLDTVRAALAGAGVAHDPATLRLEPRDGRTAVRLPGDRMAWFPHGEAGRRRLERERRVLRLVAAHCSFSVPGVLHEDPEGWEVRALVRGLVDVQGLYARLTADPVAASAIGAQLGTILAEQHSAIPAEGLTGWLPPRPNWPRSQAPAHLLEVTDDATLLARIASASAVRLSPRSAGPVLVHGDVGVHNIAMAPDGTTIAGVFDYDGAAFGDRHYDFRYLLTDQPDEEALLEGAIAAYEPLTGANIDRHRVRLLNARSAVGFLAFRRGHPPEEPWCGRTLEQDLAWTDRALTRAGF